MKLSKFRYIFAHITNVRLIVDGKYVVYEGCWCNVPAEYSDYIVDLITPIIHPYNSELGALSIIIYRECEE